MIDFGKNIKLSENMIILGYEAVEKIFSIYTMFLGITKDLNDEDYLIKLFGLVQSYG